MSVTICDSEEQAWRFKKIQMKLHVNCLTPSTFLTHPFTRVWQMCRNQNLEPKHIAKAYVCGLLKSSYRCIGQALQLILEPEQVQEQHGEYICG